MDPIFVLRYSYADPYEVSARVIIEIVTHLWKTKLVAILRCGQPFLRYGKERITPTCNEIESKHFCLFVKVYYTFGQQ